MTVNSTIVLPSGVVLKNRLLFAPISTLDSDITGRASQGELAFFAERTGGVGGIVVASAYVSLVGKAYEHGLSVSHKSHISHLSQLAKIIQKNGTKAFLQIYHGGAMTHFVRQPQYFCVSQASANLGNVAYTELGEKEIEQIVLDYEKGIERSILAGFDGVEIHASNSYLPQQFLMSSWNQRTDRWGGVLNNRLRFLTEIIQRGLKVIDRLAKKPFALGVRLSLEDNTSSVVSVRQQSFRESLLIIQALNDYPLDYIHVTSHDILQTVMVENHPYQVLRLLKVMSPKVPLIGCGNLLQPDDIESALENCQLVSACRPFVLLPKWADQIIQGQEVQLPVLNMSGSDRQLLRIPRRLWKSVKESTDWYLYR
ncbi:hypothetical protein I6N95_07490 [Vagococcus sp. BWB3-3]|uniref:NADH:flavin oxidoreductase/NADH oxidase N-terminal domain-containing protein n=1 Tax=Vagococcus allomyrinae TaxID=2794353 RepID=A0A940SUI9_9ENTE|nr:hypothetical protein [Vagococcus allomyrinae]MBP1040844.1 hypothetical protein [Vagococcus allomyrinae]